VKGVRFEGHVDMGDASELAARYRDDVADELVFYDITASPEGRTLDYGWVREIARSLNIPFRVAGGIRSAHQAAACSRMGRTRSINSLALERPELISEMAERLGSSAWWSASTACARTATTSCRMVELDGTAAGRATTMDLIVEAQVAGCEIVLMIDQDGVRKGYDTAQLGDAVATDDPAGGLWLRRGDFADFLDVFDRAVCALAASVFHSGTWWWCRT